MRGASRSWGRGSVVSRGAAWWLLLGGTVAVVACGDDDGSSSSSQTGGGGAGASASGGAGAVGGAGASAAGGGGAGGAGAGGSGGGGAGPGCETTALEPTRGGAIALSADDATLVVANRDAGSVTVIGVDWSGALPALTKVAELDVGGEPWQVAIDACGTRAYVALRRDAKLVAIDDLGGAPTVGAEVPVGAEPTAVALSPNNRRVFVANWVDGTVSEIDTETMAVVDTHDLNPTLAETGLLGDSVDAATARPALAHPRSLAVTNDGDADDDDETLLVTEFFAQRTEPEAANGANADVNWEGLVYKVPLSGAAPSVIELPALADTGFLDGNGATTGCFPNQLQSLSIRGANAYVTSICASPKGPAGGTSLKTMTHPVVHTFAVATGAAVGAPVNLNAAFDAFYVAQAFADDASRRYPLVPSDLTFSTDGDLYVAANGTDAVFRAEVDGAGEISAVGAGGTHPFVDLAPSAAPAASRGENPVGVAAAHGHPFAFVANDVSRNVTAIDLADDVQAIADLGGTPRVLASTDAPASATEQARLRGKRAFNTGTGRWSLNGQGWGACQVCHFEGLSDNVTWYFARGPRQSTSLDGSFDKQDPSRQRIFNWTGVFDEISDFENVARSLDGAVGALVHTESDPPVNGDRIDLTDTAAYPPAGASGLNGAADDANDASVRKDWSDIEIFIQTVRPPRAPTTLDATDVAAGKVLFEDASAAGGCQGCHGGPLWTLSTRFYVPSGATNEALKTTAYDGPALIAAGFPAALLPATAGSQLMRSGAGGDQIQCVLRPVGTYGVSPAGVGTVELRADMVTAGQGDDPNGRGFNIPSLFGLQVGAPFFHAGNARTLEELLSATFTAHHEALTQTAGFLDTVAARRQLVAYLLSIDGDAAPITPPATAGAAGGTLCSAP